MSFPRGERGCTRSPSRVQELAPGREHTGQEGVRKSSHREEKGCGAEQSCPPPEVLPAEPVQGLHSMRAVGLRTGEGERRRSGRGVAGNRSARSCCYCSGRRWRCPSFRRRWWGLRVHPYCALPGTAEGACTASPCGGRQPHRKAFDRCCFSDKEKHAVQSSTCTDPSGRICKHNAMQCCRFDRPILQEHLQDSRLEKNVRSDHQLIR